ncbi:MAG: hypothetical protein JRF28_10470 [Deltaproteobacteria bacterium]|nr:hypothetical protein [Deltaproteobacteria bacterium]
MTTLGIENRIQVKEKPGPVIRNGHTAEEKHVPEVAKPAQGIEVTVSQRCLPLVNL